MSEYLINRIPDQRIERVIQFVEQLSHRLDHLEASLNPNDPRFVELFEDAVEQASRSHGKHRTGYLTNIVIPYEPESDAEWQVRRKLLQIIRELTDLDIEILIGHLTFESLMRVEREYRSSPMISLRQREEFSDREMFAVESQSSFFDLHVATLERLRLLSPVMRKPDLVGAQDREFGFAEAFANATDDHGGPVVERHRVTQMGRLLIGAITGQHPRSQ